MCERQTLGKLRTQFFGIYPEVMFENDSGLSLEPFQTSLKLGHTLYDYRNAVVQFQIIVYKLLFCNVKQKLTIYVLRLSGPIVQDLTAHTVRVNC